LCPSFCLRSLIVQIIVNWEEFDECSFFFFYHDLKVYPTQTTPPPEGMFEAAPNDEEANDVKTLTERLSAALLNSRAKEDLAKQHAKVAEEAVSGICCLVILHINNFSLI